MRESYDVFLVLQRFRVCASEHLAALGALEDVVNGHLMGAEGYCNPGNDTGLVVLRFSERSLQFLGSRAIHEMVAHCGLPMVIPGMLGAAERRSFYLEHLSGYDVYLQQYPAQHESYPLLTRTLIGLAAHCEELAGSDTALVEEHNILSELPIASMQYARPRRLESVL